MNVKLSNRESQRREAAMLAILDAHAETLAAARAEYDALRGEVSVGRRALLDALCNYYGMVTEGADLLQDLRTFEAER